MTVTVGVATLPIDAADGASLVARADAALYAGKHAGRNRVVSASEAAAAGAGPLPDGNDPHLPSDTAPPSAAPADRQASERRQP